MLFIWTKGRLYVGDGTSAPIRYDVRVIAPDRKTAYAAAKDCYGAQLLASEGDRTVVIEPVPGKTYALHYSLACETLVVLPALLVERNQEPLESHV